MFKYDSHAICAEIPIERYLAARGYEIRETQSGKRTQAKWRNGNGFNVSITGEKWTDFAVKDGWPKSGNLYTLCKIIDGLEGTRATQKLGDEFHVTPKMMVKKARKQTAGEILMSKGFNLATTYTYTDEHANPLYFVDRFELWKDGKREEKQFVQRSPHGDGIRGVRRVLYNLPAVIAAAEVIITEGEKDVETLRKWGLVATTNSGGGSVWSAEFSKVLAGKKIVILPDNDETGRKHAAEIFASVSPVAESVKIVTLSSKEKGDVTDWIENENGTPALLRAAILSALPPDFNEIARQAAKSANAKPFENYEEDFVEYTDKDGKTRKRRVINPRLQNDLTDEAHTRFMGFPRRLGSSLFDFDRAAKKIAPLLTPSAVFSWMRRVGNIHVNWEAARGCISKSEFFEALYQTAMVYEGSSPAPHYPPRDNFYYTFDALPRYEEDHAAFWKFVDRFTFATATDRLIAAAYFVAPMFYQRGIPRPAFAIGTVDAQGSGKSTVAEMAAELYGESHLQIDLRTIAYDATQMKKRLLSPAGRCKRHLTIDNVTTSLSGGALAELITAPSFSGLAPYGHGEETRENDLTITVTVNGAETDTDSATRFYNFKVRKYATDNRFWKSETLDFINSNKSQIYADIIHMMATAPARFRRDSRFKEFDAVVLSAVCATDEEFREIDNSLSKEAKAANMDEDRATLFEELIEERIATSPEMKHCLGMPLIIRTTDISEILATTKSDLHGLKLSTIRNLIRTGNLPLFSKRFEALPDTPEFKGFRYRSFFWGMDRMTEGAENETANLTEAEVIRMEHGTFVPVKRVTIHRPKD